MKKHFVIFFAALFVLASGCFKQAEVKTPGDPTVSWISGTEKMETAEESSDGNKTVAKVETKKTSSVETRVEAKAEPKPEPKPEPPALVQQPAAKTTPPHAAPQSTPTPQPTRTAAAAPPPPRTPPVFNAGVPGGPAVPAMLVEGDYQVEEYRSPVHGWTPGWMLRVDNHTSTYQLVSSAGTVPIFRMSGQCVDGLGMANGNCPFAVRIDRDSNQPVVLLKPGHSAQFVVDQNMCPPSGARCQVKAQAASYGTTQPKSKRQPRTRSLTQYFTGEGTGRFMSLR